TFVANLVADRDEQEVSRVERIALLRSREAIAEVRLGPGARAHSVLCPFWRIIIPHLTRLATTGHYGAGFGFGRRLLIALEDLWASRDGPLRYFWPALCRCSC